MFHSSLVLLLTRQLDFCPCVHQVHAWSFMETSCMATSYQQITLDVHHHLLCKPFMLINAAFSIMPYNKLTKCIWYIIGICMECNIYTVHAKTMYSLASDYLMVRESNSPSKKLYLSNATKT